MVCNVQIVSSINNLNIEIYWLVIFKNTKKNYITAVFYIKTKMSFKSIQAFMWNSCDPKKIKDHYSFTKTTSGEDAEKWSGVKDHMSTLQWILSQPN